ncbi:MAG: hypothetical protein J7D61_07745 [Marichromatium sp.]|nr:hypothetical protein [Marichromatium sp.]
MPVVPITNLGQAGLIRDVPETALPINGLTEAENIRSNGTSISRAGAFVPVESGMHAGGTTAGVVEAIHRHMAPQEVQDVYLCTDTRHIYRYTGTQFEDVSPDGHIPVSGAAPITATSLALLPYFASANIPVLGRAAESGSRFTPVMAGSAHAGTKWRVVRAHKDRLFVLNGSDDNGEYPQRVMWSGPTMSGALATDWETASLESTAGFVDLSGFAGEILDCHPMGEFLYVYGAYGVSRLWESGDQFIFGNAPVLSEDGLLATRCVAPLSEYGHFVVGRNSIYLFDGHQRHAIASDRVEQEFRRTLDTERLSRMFVFPDYRKKEVWICYPSRDTRAWFSGDDVQYANRALVWDYSHNTWSFRDLPNVADMATVAVQGAVDTWDTVTTPATRWSGESGTWSSATGVSHTLPLAAIRPCTGPEGAVPEMLAQFDDAAYPEGPWNCPTSSIGRTGITLAELGLTRWGQKAISRVSLGATTYGQEGQELRVSVGMRDHQQGAWHWERDIPYRPAEQSWANVRLQGKQLGYRIAAAGVATMDLTQIDLEIQEIAQR